MPSGSSAGRRRRRRRHLRLRSLAVCAPGLKSRMLRCTASPLPAPSAACAARRSCGSTWGRRGCRWAGVTSSRLGPLCRPAPVGSPAQLRCRRLLRLVWATQRMPTLPRTAIPHFLPCVNPSRWWSWTSARTGRRSRTSWRASRCKHSQRAACCAGRARPVHAGGRAASGLNAPVPCHTLRLALFAALQGGRTVPRIFVDGQFIGGADDVTAKDASGELAALLKQKGLVA